MSRPSTPKKLREYAPLFLQSTELGTRSESYSLPHQMHWPPVEALQLHTDPSSQFMV